MRTLKRKSEPELRVERQLGASTSLFQSVADVTSTSGFPAIDTTAIVHGSADPSKKIRFEVDGLSSGQTRVMTVPDRDLTIAPDDVATTSAKGLMSAADKTKLDGLSELSGTANKIAKFTTSTAIGDSIITESGDKIGINTASPQRTIHIHATAGNSPGIRMTDADVAHGITTFGLSTDTVLQISNLSSTVGGVLAWGLSSAGNTTGFNLWGITGSSTPTVPPVLISCSKKDGSNNPAVVGNSEIAFQIENVDSNVGSGTKAVTILGNGNTGFGPTNPGERVDVTGNVNVSGVFKVSTNQVVGARKTGWSTATGTATRTSFDTATVTLAQLAERVKALIDDLHATAGHGLLGS